MNQLTKYFTDGVESKTLETIGAEIETQFIDDDGDAISADVSQDMLKRLESNGWRVVSEKNSLITSISDNVGNRISYELGRHNIELSTVATSPDKTLGVVNNCLSDLYGAANEVGAKPFFGPILGTNDDLLIIPDERDAIWLELDGREALAPLTRTSSVQYTIPVALGDAIPILNKLGDALDQFLSDFPQDEIWREYIIKSNAQYNSDRYGGPLKFGSIEDYCERLIEHDVVYGSELVEYNYVEDLDIPLYLRSIWWHFRLRRYGSALCVEVRPMARREDDQLSKQLDNILNIIR